MTSDNHLDHTILVSLFSAFLCTKILHKFFLKNSRKCFFVETISHDFSIVNWTTQVPFSHSRYYHQTWQIPLPAHTHVWKQCSVPHAIISVFLRPPRSEIIFCLWMVWKRHPAFPIARGTQRHSNGPSIPIQPWRTAPYWIRAHFPRNKGNPVHCSHLSHRQKPRVPSTPNPSPRTPQCPPCPPPNPCPITSAGRSRASALQPIKYPSAAMYWAAPEQNQTGTLEVKICFWGRKSPLWKRWLLAAKVSLCPWPHRATIKQQTPANRWMSRW